MPVENTSVKLLVKAPEAAAMLSISLRTLMGLVSAGKVPYRRIGERCLRFSVRELEAWASDQTRKSESNA